MILIVLSLSLPLITVDGTGRFLPLFNSLPGLFGVTLITRLVSTLLIPPLFFTGPSILVCCCSVTAERVLLSFMTAGLGFCRLKLLLSVCWEGRSSDTLLAMVFRLLDLNNTTLAFLGVSLSFFLGDNHWSSPPFLGETTRGGWYRRHLTLCLSRPSFGALCAPAREG